MTDPLVILNMKESHALQRYILALEEIVQAHGYFTLKEWTNTTSDAFDKLSP